MPAKRKSKAPISSHPVFPAIVALWFAALFGIGSLVLPTVLFEKLFSITGISSVIPAAAPPLGVTARILIALAAAGFGVAAGLFIARKVAASQHEQQGSDRARNPAGEAGTPVAKKPISAHEELGVGGLDEPEDYAPPPPPIPGRNRPLSVTDDSGVSEYLDDAPLPGAADDRDHAPYELEWEAEPQAPESETLELAEFHTGDASERYPESIEEAGENAGADGQFGTGALSLPFSEPASERPSIRFEEDETQSVAARPFDRPFDGAQEPGSPPTPVSDANSLAGIDVTPETHQEPNPEPSEEELEEIAAHDFGERIPAPFAKPYTPFEQDDQPVDLSEPFDPKPFGNGDDAPDNAVSLAPDHAFLSPSMDGPSADDAIVDGPIVDEEGPEAGENEPVATDSAPLATRTLGELNMSELVERFTLSLQQASEQAETAEQAEGHMDEPIAEEPAAEPVSTPGESEETSTPPAPYVPAALRELEIDASEDEMEANGEEDAGLAFGLPVASAPKPFAEGPAEDEGIPQDEEPVEAAAESEEEAEPDGYSSLLDLKGRFGQEPEFVRIEEDEAPDEPAPPEPVVVFPGQEKRRAKPAVDGPSRDPDAAPFAAPQDAAAEASADREPAPVPIPTPVPPANNAAAERALRDALEKLQRMSGAA